MGEVPITQVDANVVGAGCRFEENEVSGLKIGGTNGPSDAYLLFRRARQRPGENVPIDAINEPRAVGAPGGNSSPLMRRAVPAFDLGAKPRLDAM